MTAGWSSGLWSSLRNQRSRVQIPVVSRVFVMNNYTCLRVMAVYIYIIINIVYKCTIYVYLSVT
jgi:hypothetical protein